MSLTIHMNLSPCSCFFSLSADIWNEFSGISVHRDNEIQASTEYIGNVC